MGKTNSLCIYSLTRNKCLITVEKYYQYLLNIKGMISTAVSNRYNGIDNERNVHHYGML